MARAAGRGRADATEPVLAGAREIKGEPEGDAGADAERAVPEAREVAVAQSAVGAAAAEIIDASPAAAARRDLDRRRRGARAFAEEERRRARAQRVERAQAERRYKHRLSNEAVRAENARQATLAEHARARVFVAERPDVFNGGVERPERVLPKPRTVQEEDLPPLPPKRLVKEEVCAEEEDFEGLLDDAAPAPEAPAPRRAPPAPTSPTSPTGYSDDAEDFEDDESDAEDEAAIGVGVQVEARFGGEEDRYPHRQGGSMRTAPSNRVRRRRRGRFRRAGVRAAEACVALSFVLRCAAAGDGRHRYGARHKAAAAARP